MQEAIHDPTKHRQRNASEREAGAPPEVGRGGLVRLIGLTVARVILSHLDKKPRVFTPSRWLHNSRPVPESRRSASGSTAGKRTNDLNRQDAVDAKQEDAETMDLGGLGALAVRLFCFGTSGAGRFASFWDVRRRRAGGSRRRVRRRHRRSCPSISRISWRCPGRDRAPWLRGSRPPPVRAFQPTRPR